MVTGTYSRDNDLTKWSRDQLISRLKTLEGVCGTMYKDEYIRDRNQRIGLAIVNIRDNSMALSQMEYRVKELSRLVRRFERLTEHACPEVERFVVDKLQERSEMLRGECELMEVRLAALNQKRADMETKCHEVSADFDTMRRDLQDSRRELGENQARCQRSKAEVDDLKKEIEEKKKAMSEIAAGAQQSAMLKSFDKMKLDAKREAEMADKSREITSATVREYEQTAAMLQSAKEELRACESEYERANAKLAAVKKDLRHATAELAEIKKKSA
jgi:DNA repair exonuclease SbcCD ATPase subunit